MHLNVHILKKAQKSFWFVPVIFSLISLLVALVTFSFDWWLSQHNYPFLPKVLFANFNLSTMIISTIASSIMTMTTITFSTIMVVLTTFLSQYSPRTLQNFINDRPTQRVLAIFVSGVVYCITLLILLKDESGQELFISAAFAALVAIICLFVFVYFVHHVSNWVKVSNLIHNITIKTNKKIEESPLYRDKDENNSEEEIHSISFDDTNPVYSYSNSSGYLQHIEIEGLMKKATHDGCIVRLLKTPGEYLLEGTAVMTIWSANEEIKPEEYVNFLILGPDKEPIEDIDLGIRKLVEIALRAISPAINDPNTAKNCIEEIGIILSKLARYRLPGSYITDSESHVRIILEQPSFDDYLYKSFYQLRHYGKQDISVTTEILRSLSMISENNKGDVKKIIWTFKDYILEGIDYESLQNLDMKYLMTHIEKLASSCELSDWDHDKIRNTYFPDKYKTSDSFRDTDLKT
ncbi:DUF2254 domain-containing protein [Rossellomorea aquimaris]|uniref:DUF2254 domain-containing protein n=1 Tax=Rossellomorea aquimaris TaxID=189382 RepID=UPI001CD72BE8|nr:DUF2254 domain-containing protein [Rossellomorea aquimaris]MCA1056644.1 DUF2254 domain-containing protein [Rossellomorea aquimaris]